MKVDGNVSPYKTVIGLVGVGAIILACVVGAIWPAPTCEERGGHLVEVDCERGIKCDLREGVFCRGKKVCDVRCEVKP